MRNGDIYPYILSVHIRGTQGIRQFAVRSEHKDILHRRFDETHSRSERAGRKKNPHILSDFELGFASSHPKYFRFLGAFHLSIVYAVAPFCTSPVVNKNILQALCNKCHPIGWYRGECSGLVFQRYSVRIQDETSADLTEVFASLFHSGKR